MAKASTWAKNGNSRCRDVRFGGSRECVVGLGPTLCGFFCQRPDFNGAPMADGHKLEAIQQIGWDNDRNLWETTSTAGFDYMLDFVRLA